MQRVLYPRIVFRTRGSAAVCLIVAFSLALSIVALIATRWARPMADLVLLAVFVTIPSALAIRVLHNLAELERQHAEPDATMVLLFDLSLMLPVISLVVAVLAMRISS